MIETTSNGLVQWNFDAADGETLFAAAIMVSIASIVVYVIRAWLLGRIFKKAGLGRWKAWVPIVNEFTFFNIGGRSGANILLGIFGYFLLSLGYFSAGLAVQGAEQPVAMPVWCIVAMTIGVVFLFFYVYRYFSAVWNIQKKFGKSGPFVILFFITAIAPLWYWLLALDSSKYNDKVGRPQIK